MLSTENDAIDFECFLKMLSRKVSTSAEEELKEVFDVFDLNMDGFISISELYDLMVRLGEKASMVSLKFIAVQTRPRVNRYIWQTF